MSDITREVIDLLEWEELLDDFKSSYGFDLRRDLKNNSLSRNDFLIIIQDLFYDINAVPIKGDKVTANPPISVYKMRFKDENRNIGSSSAYRLLCMIDESKAIPFHLYHKTSGKKPKIDLTESEKRKCKKMVDDAVKQRKQGG